ncbi:MAG: SCO family protein [Acidobacteriota bacterium]
MRNNSPVLTMCVLLLALLLVGCGSKPPQPSESAKRFEVRGKVVAVDRPNKKVTIDHQAIVGYMDAMTMPFTLVDDWAFSDLQPGATIQATLVVDTGRTWLENPIITSAGPAIGKEVVVEPRPGDEVPDLRFVTQDGKKIHLQQYRGRTVLLTFIYTRCPLPDYCPLMSSNFAAINNAIEEKGLAGQVHLLSVSVDPAYDRPGVLRRYALPYTGGQGFKRWDFVTGTKDEIKAAAEFFGLSYWPEKDQIIHSLRTAIIGPDGKVARVYRGNEWKPEEVLKDLAEITGEAKKSS